MVAVETKNPSRVSYDRLEWPATAPLQAAALVRPYTAARDSFRLLAISNIVLLPLAILAYGDHFTFWSAPFSDLGAVRTSSGHPNIPGLVLFALYMLSGSLIMFRYGRTATPPSVPLSRLRRILAYAAAAGYLIGAAPNDRLHIMHTIGCGIMVGSLWMIGNIFSWEIRKLGRNRDALVVQAILQASVLPYAAAYFAGSDLKQTLQKIAVAGLFVSLTAATRFLRSAITDEAFRRAGYIQPQATLEVAQERRLTR